MSNPDPSDHGDERGHEERLELRVLGPMELWRAGERIPLPRSKKTRALFAYLAVTGRTHLRERLCDLLWEHTDDPRGALRWSLSRLRRAVPWDDDKQLESTRSEVTLHGASMLIDANQLSACVSGGIADAPTEQLARLAESPRGPFIEGLELPDLMSFDAWCVAQRERLREEHCAVLEELVRRLSRQPESALPYARMRAEQDALSIRAHTDLLQLLIADGKAAEAETRYENCRRLFAELGATGLSELEAAWRELYVRSAVPAVAPPTPAATSPQRAKTAWPFVGRRNELEALEAELFCARGERPRVALVTGEPGAGKSRLAEHLMDKARGEGFAVLSGRAYEAESTRPFGPWVDALDVDLRELVAAQDSGAGGGRDALFAAVLDQLATRASDKGALVVLDDLQWLDSDSLELVHFVARKYNHGPLLIALLARGGELSDNEAATRAIRSLRSEQRLNAIELEPLSLSEIEDLLGSQEGLDAHKVFEASAGNPLYAIELARAGAERATSESSSLVTLVRERVEQLTDHATDVLRWVAVLGHSMTVERLEALCSLELEQLVAALEYLESHALLRADPARPHERYVFSHDVVREAVYGDLSFLRRRLMHKKVVELLSPRTSEAPVATEVAHHAALAGEALPGVRACIVAGKRSLRVFAYGDAESLARRGLRLAEQLDEAERVTATLDLLHLQYSARTPDREGAAERVRGLAERALDLDLTHAARLGFQMLSFLRWESSSMAAAHDNIMQAERVSRSAEPEERCVALAQAAKCLVLLERNLNQAEAFVLEADGLTNRGVPPTAAVCFANGMIDAHRGELGVAVENFREASQLARQHGERLTEFAAIEHRTMLEIDRGDPCAAREIAAPLVDLGARVRPGAEGPSGRGLLALAELMCGETDSEATLDEALAGLRKVDAKYQQAFLLTRWADHCLRSGDLESAEARAREALEVARALGRPSETAFAHAILADCAGKRGDDEARATQLQELDNLDRRELSKPARERIQRAR